MGHLAILSIILIVMVCCTIVNLFIVITAFCLVINKDESRIFLVVCVLYCA